MDSQAWIKLCLKYQILTYSNLRHDVRQVHLCFFFIQTQLCQQQKEQSPTIEHEGMETNSSWITRQLISMQIRSSLKP